MGNNVMMHLSIFGNTNNILEHEPSVSLDRIERIQDMLKWNKNKIDNANDLLADRNSFVHFLGYQQEYRSKLRFYHEVRQRLTRAWNNELNKLKL